MILQMKLLGLSKICRHHLSKILHGYSSCYSNYIVFACSSACLPQQSLSSAHLDYDSGHSDSFPAYSSVSHFSDNDEYTPYTSDSFRFRESLSGFPDECIQPDIHSCRFRSRCTHLLQDTVFSKHLPKPVTVFQENFDANPVITPEYCLAHTTPRSPPADSGIHRSPAAASPRESGTPAPSPRRGRGRCRR